MKKWAAFWLVGLIWGSSFLFIRVGVEQMSPFQLVFIRTGIAAIGLNLVLLARGKRLPLTREALIPLALLGLGNTTIPFALITWGEKTVESGLASVLNATTPLFTLVIAHFTLADERITAQKLIGLVIGFIGVIVLASRSLDAGQATTNSLVGQLAVIGGALFYAIFIVYSRKVIRNQFEPLMISTGAMTFAALSAGLGMIAAPALGGQAAVPLVALRTDVLLAGLMLGVLNTFVAYLMFYWIIQQLGSARASMVTYVIPAVGLTLGAFVLGESIDARLLVGAALILMGIITVNLRWRRVMRSRVAQAA